jgi:cellulose synthase/poly-beta-1,6-N-acetylglucosamine synthase-like glycosyltransferase
MRLTVGICAFNEEENLGLLLRNILEHQDISKNSEVLVVASGCTDRTVEITEEYAIKDSRVKVFNEIIREGKASAINKIFANATGEAIIFISADTLPWKDCFKKLLLKLQSPNVGIVCGKPLPINDTNSLADRLVRMLWSFHDHVFAELNDAGLAKHATEVFCIRRGIVHSIPPETINDDAHIALSAKKKGWLIKYEPGSIVSICGPRTFTDYVKQRQRILRGHLQVKKATGESPQHMLYFLPQHPIISVKLLAWLIKANGIFMSLAFGLIELFLNATAITKKFSKKREVAWSVAQSTKKIQLPIFSLLNEPLIEKEA